MGELTKRGRYRFGVFELDADSLELHKQGRAVRLRPQALKLLRLLVQRAGELVSRETIQHELWGDETFIDFEQGVNHAIKQLRMALGDDAESPRYIQTLPRRGYRFIGTAERLASQVGPQLAGHAAPQPPPDSAASAVGQDVPHIDPHTAPRLTPFDHPRSGSSSPIATRVASSQVWPWMVMLATLIIGSLIVVGWRAWRSHPAARAAAPIGVAVLPFATSGLSPEAEFLGASVADAVTARLSMGGRTRVTPASVVAAYRRRTADPHDIGRALGLDYVLHGTLRRDGRAYRLEAELIRVSDARGVSAAGTLTVSAGDLLALETRVVDQVLARLTTPRPRPAEHETRHAGAYEAYLQGRFHLSRYTANDTETAVALFERALASDESYALAHAGLARSAALMYIRFAPQQSADLWKARAERAAARALALNDGLAEAHEALAAVARYTDFDWEAVIHHSAEALRLNPGLDLPHYYLASALQHMGRLDLVEREVAAGLEANPLNLAEAFRLRGVNALWGSQFDLARSYLQRVRELSDRPVSDPHLAQALYYVGQPLVAEATLAELTGSAQAEQRGDALRASFLAARGARREALALAERVESRAYRDHHVAYSLGAAYAALGRHEDAVHWLREAVRTGFLCRPWYEKDPLLAPLRPSPAFQKLLAEMTRISDRLALSYAAR